MSSKPGMPPPIRPSSTPESAIRKSANPFRQVPATENFPPFLQAIAESQADTSLNLSIGAQAALSEHLRHLDKYGLDGDIEHHKNKSPKGLDAEWERYLALSHVSVASSMLQDPLNQETARSYIHSGIGMVFNQEDSDGKEESTTISSYFESSRVLNLATPDRVRNKLGTVKVTLRNGEEDEESPPLHVLETPRCFPPRYEILADGASPPPHLSPSAVPESMASFLGGINISHISSCDVDLSRISGTGCPDFEASFHHPPSTTAVTLFPEEHGTCEVAWPDDSPPTSPLKYIPVAVLEDQPPENRNSTQPMYIHRYNSKPILMKAPAKPWKPKGSNKENEQTNNPTLSFKNMASPERLPLKTIGSSAIELEAPRMASQLRERGSLMEKENDGSSNSEHNDPSKPLNESRSTGSKYPKSPMCDETPKKSTETTAMSTPSPAKFSPNLINAVPTSGQVHYEEDVDARDVTLPFTNTTRCSNTTNEPSVFSLSHLERRRFRSVVPVRVFLDASDFVPEYDSFDAPASGQHQSYARMYAKATNSS